MSRQQAAEAAARDHTGRIGASRAAACLGKDPRTSPTEAWCEIRGEPLLKDKPEWLVEAGHWGTVLEEPVAKHGYTHQTGAKLARVNRTLRLPSFPVSETGPNKGSPALTCHLDRRVLGVRPGTLYQGKTRSVYAREDWGDPWTDDIPKPELIQVSIEIGIANAVFRGQVARSHVGTLFGGQSFVIFDVERNPRLEAGLLHDLREWYLRHIRDGIEPEPMSEDDCRLLYRQAHTESRDASPSDLELIRRHVEAAAEAARAVEAKKAAAFALRKAMGRTEAILHDDGSAPRKNRKMASWPQTWEVDADKLAEDHPKLVAAHSTILDADALRREDPDAFADLIGRYGKLDAAAFRKAEPKVWARYKIGRKRGDLRVSDHAKELFTEKESQGTKT